MKRGKDDDKVMGPMFPRLNVNDTEKGGPRAPPRNKMALYEQLSIPSQRFNHGMLPLNPDKAASVVPPASSSQGSGHERRIFFQLHLTRSTEPAEKTSAGCSDFNIPLAQLEQKKRLDDEDFTVPTFAQTETVQDHSKNSNGMDRGKFFPSNPAYLSQSMNIQNTGDKEPKRGSITGFSLRQEHKSQNENLKEFVAHGDESVKYIDVSPAKKKPGGPSKQNSDILQSTGESRARPQLHNCTSANGVSNEHIEVGHFPVLGGDSCPEKLGSPNNDTNDGEYHENKRHGSLQAGSGDRSDNASETSMVDSIPGLDISPDDVVGMIGQKHFWKARRAIVNQQRVFSVQVFELHRLIRVQRSIAGSPNLLIEDGAYLGKPLKVSLAKKLTLDYIVKPPPLISKPKDDSENPNHKMECSAENAVEKTTLSSVQNVNQPSNYTHFSGNPLSSPNFHQPPGHQWLIPVMSPSEGLIYKPYHPGHGFVGPVYGGFAPPGPNSVMGSFLNPAYGAPPPHHHYPGLGFPSATPAVGHGYFPLYPQAINPVKSGSVEQANSLVGQGLLGQPGQSLGGGVQPQKHRAIPAKVRASKGSEVQGSTASSPGERERGIGVGPTTEGGNALNLFPTSLAANVTEGASQLHDTEQPIKVIKVVPHNARLATESAARIFQSIQEERKNHDSV